MRTITLPRHYWVGFRRPTLVQERQATAPLVATHDTQPRAPATPQQTLWDTSKLRLFGITLPNRLQTLFFTTLCSALALPVFLFDRTGEGLRHGLVTLGSLAGFAALCWTVGMALANFVADHPEDSANKPR